MEKKRKKKEKYPFEDELLGQIWKINFRNTNNEFQVKMKGDIEQMRKSGKTWVRVDKSGLVGRVFTSGPGDLGLIPGCVIPKTLKMVLDTSMLNTQQYKVHIKGKVEQSRERSNTLPYTSV